MSISAFTRVSTYSRRLAALEAQGINLSDLENARKTAALVIGLFVSNEQWAEKDLHDCRFILEQFHKSLDRFYWAFPRKYPKDAGFEIVDLLKAVKKKQDAVVDKTHEVLVNMVNGSSKKRALSNSPSPRPAKRADIIVVSKSPVTGRDSQLQNSSKAVNSLSST